MVDICVYRARIGIFCHKVRKVNTMSKEMFFRKGSHKYKFKSLFIWVVLLSIYSTVRVDAVSQNSFNKNSHIANGNIKKSSLKLLHWNKGPSFFHNKIDHIKYILEEQKPHIFSVSEANYLISRNNHDIRIGGYNYEWTDQKCNYDISRQILIIHTSIEYI